MAESPYIENLIGAIKAGVPGLENSLTTALDLGVPGGGYTAWGPAVHSVLEPTIEEILVNEVKEAFAVQQEDLPRHLNDPREGFLEVIKCRLGELE